MPEPRVLRVALTGGIATGKTYVRQRLQEADLPTIDADVLAREAIAPGSEGLREVIARFGPDVLTPDGAIDRARLGARVFGDDAARVELETIIHPVVYGRIRRWFAQLERLGYRGPAVADIPLLFETGRQDEFHVVVVVRCAPSTQLARVQARDGLSADAAAQRLAAQWPIDTKVRMAHAVIDTEGTFAETDAQVRDLVERLRRQADVA